MVQFLNRLAATVLTLLIATPGVAQDRPRVVTVNYPLQYFAERLLGDSVDVLYPVPENVDPSFWRPSIADISMIQSADLILLNGAGFANWVDRVSLPRSRLVDTTAAISDQLIVTESITHSHGDGGQHSHEGVASYTWLDPTLAIAQAEAIAAAITERGLALEKDVEARLSTLRADLEALDAEAREALTDIQDIAIIATHPRYQYLERRYGLSITSLEWGAGAIPNVDEIADLRAMMEETGALILIWEAEPNAAAIEAIAETGIQSLTFAPLAHRATKETFIGAFREGLSSLSDATVHRSDN